MQDFVCGLLNILMAYLSIEDLK